jgi:murein DD-endopeptidase MepM/ murein hydrolase activator NlpD
MAQPSYPLIHSLNNDDIVFAQLSEGIERFHEGENVDTVTLELSLFCYRLGVDTDLFALAAACSIPYDALATLNRIGTAQTLTAGTTILIPSLPGLFVCDKPDNDLEFLVRSLWTGDQAQHYQIKAFVGGRQVDFTFFPGAAFHPSERTFFLVAGFRFPLPKGVITSGFGARVDPFSGKKITYHSGIDIGAPFGTTVFASRSGRVEETGYSDIYGNYILISHDSTWETLYGHLAKILVAKGLWVRAGDTIGLVGSTGMSTGPHLHFETRKRGVATDPSQLIIGKP